MILRKTTTVFFFLGCSLFAKAQPAGFLGAVNGITLKTNIVPSHRWDCEINENEINRHMKLANLSYSLSYSRVITRNIELTAGYQFAKINFTAGRKWFDGEPMIYNGPVDHFAEHSSGVYHGGFLAFDYYRFGSLSPVGKYLGFSISAGVTQVKEDSFFVISDRYEKLNEGFFSTQYSFSQLDTVTIDKAMNVVSFALKARIGRNYPITDKLMLCVGMSAPLISTYKADGFQYTGLELRESANFDYNTNKWRRYASESVRVYHRLQFELGLRLCL